MGEYADIVAALRRARAERDSARDGVYAARVELLDLSREQEHEARGERVDEHGRRRSDVPERLDEARRRLAERKAQLARHEGVVSDLAGRLSQRPPADLLGEWDDETPILLLPLRVETKFKTIDGRQQLWVRAYPDEIAITTHEPVLTVKEQAAGIDYWKALRAAAGDDARAAAWRTLADARGANRAAWVALQTRPTNWGDPPPASDDDLVFPPLESTKPDSWTQAPHSVVMPDRLVLMLFRGDAAVKTIVGNPIADHVVVGPAPLDEDEDGSIARDAEGRLVYGDDFKWLIDFRDAEKRGLAFVVALTADDVRGFDRLVVLGVKHSADEHDGQHLVESLIENHHYSAKGFSLVPQGTATNNTDGHDAGFTRDDWLHDVSVFVENGDPLFTVEANAARASDGQRLAEYLGIRYETLDHIRHSDGLDHADAVAMNRALYGATLGYYLDSMLNDVMSDATARRVREFFTDHVSGRGPVSAIRVGNQPYGVLVTSAGDAWTYRPSSFTREPPIDLQVHRATQRGRQAWRSLAPQLARIGHGGDSRKSLMAVLGLQPTSADFYHRVGYSYDYLVNLEAFTWGGRHFGDVLNAMIEGMAARQLLQDLGYDPARANGSPKPTPLLLTLVFRHFHSRLDRTNLIDGLPLAEDRGIRPYDAATGANYIDWLLAHATDVDALEHLDFGGATPPNALLFLMLHNALLQEIARSVRLFLDAHVIDASELTRSRKFMNLSAQPDVSPWEVFRAPAGRVVASEASTRPLLAFVQADRFTGGSSADIGRYVQEAKEALSHLRGASTARLERAFAEHIDTLSYRLDSWETALFDRRLRAHRRLSSGERRTGVFLGSYGYLENVRPSNTRTRVPDDVLPLPLREAIDNLYVDSQDGGYVHTPSMNHATAAAILRNGYLTHASPADRETLSVNLSSERVRRARWLIDGVRNGQSLEVLLGYLFERGLHDHTTRSDDPVVLDHLKPLFRARFPIHRTKLPRQGFAGEPAQTIDDYSVTNGLDLARLTTGFPYGITFSPPLDASQVRAIEAEKLNIDRTLDALSDLLTAESAYQLALGNFDRAAAVMQSISTGQLPVEVDVINSSRGSALGYTTRVAMHFDPSVTTNPWPAIPMTVRATTEPAMNHWIGDMLGDPATIRCTVRAVDAQGNTLVDAGVPVVGSVSLADLGLQPLDVVSMIRKKVDPAGASEIESRVRYVFARARALGDDTIVRIAFAEPGAGGGTLRSIAEVLPLADGIREVLGRSRPIDARDYAPPSKTTEATTENPGRVDVPELRARAVAVRTAFDTRFSALAAARAQADSLGTPAAIDALRDAITAIADAGFVHSFPVSAFGDLAPQLEALVAQAESLEARYDTLTPLDTADLALVDAPATPPTQRTSLLVAMVRRFLGDDFLVVPRFVLSNAADVGLAFTHRAELLSYAVTTRNIPLPIEEWLHGAALVRPTLHVLASMRTLGETFGAPDVSFAPIQLPYRADDTWLGTEFPESHEIVSDTIAIVQYLPQGFAAGGAQCGLLVDEWVETLPQREEVTGIAFNYNQPNSAPPAAILLAVTPQETGRWQWTHLVATVLDTMERAKLRAVEPDMIDTLAGIGALLPATLAEFSTAKNSIRLDYALNVKAVHDAVSALGTVRAGGGN